MPLTAARADILRAMAVMARLATRMEDRYKEEEILAAEEYLENEENGYVKYDKKYVVNRLTEKARKELRAFKKANPDYTPI